MAKNRPLELDPPSASEYFIASLKEWRKDPKAMTVPQFLHSYKVGWSALSHFIRQSDELKNEFQVTISLLADRWLQYGLSSKLLPRHMEKAFAQYLRLYDDYLWDKETEQKKDIAKSEVDTVMDYVVEDYAKATLEGLCDELYNENRKKRSFQK